MYLVFELFNGTNYVDYKNNTGGNYNETQFVKNAFKENKMVFSLASFGMSHTDESQFKYHEYMKNISQLNKQADSIRKDLVLIKKNQVENIGQSYGFHLRKYPVDTSKKDTLKIKKIAAGKWIDAKIDPMDKDIRNLESYEAAISQAKNIRDQFSTNNDIFQGKQRDVYKAEVEKWHKFTMAFACFVMFLIGSSLGSIIKKGGFGMPVLLSITFFILMYVLMQLGDKYAKEGIWTVILGVWMPDTVLLMFGLYFLYKATNDARLFESDIYDVYLEKIKAFWRSRISKKVPDIREA